MQRELKFRLLDTSNGSIIPLINFEYINGKIQMSDSYQYHQCLDKKDINNRELYESDIIMADCINQNTPYPNGTRYQIKYNPEKAEYYGDMSGLRQTSGIVNEKIALRKLKNIIWIGTEYDKYLFVLDIENEIKNNNPNVLELKYTDITKIFKELMIKDNRDNLNDFDGGHFSGNFDKYLLEKGYIRFCTNNERLFVVSQKILDKYIKNCCTVSLMANAKDNYYKFEEINSVLVDSYADVTNILLREFGLDTDYKVYVDAIYYIINKYNEGQI